VKLLRLSFQKALLRRAAEVEYSHTADQKRIVMMPPAKERSMEISGSYKELSQVLTELEKSPEARRLLPAEIFESLHKASSVESQPAPPEEKTISQSEQNTSSDKSSDPEQKTG
jgi:hypothetical protein